LPKYNRKSHYIEVIYNWLLESIFTCIKLQYVYISVDTWERKKKQTNKQTNKQIENHQQQQTNKNNRYIQIGEGKKLIV